MKLMIDTNVLVDIFCRREPFFADSYNAIRRALTEESVCLYSVSAATDLYYILRKQMQSPTKAKDTILQASQLVTFVEVLPADIDSALLSPTPDFEDAVVDAVAKRYEADYIVTRNTKDFAGSKVPAVTPTEYLARG